MQPIEPSSAKITRVIATRPAQQNVSWCARIDAAGLTSAQWPLLQIDPLTRGTPAAERIKQQILNFAYYDSIIFVSQNAVHEAFQWLDEYWPQLPEKMHYLAVGQKTAAAIKTRLRDFGSTDSVSAPDNAMDTESLLQLPLLQDVKDSAILICRGLGGRPRLGEELEARGARVDYCELYQRSLPSQAEATLLDLRLDSAHDLLSFYSGETLQNGLKLILENNIIDWQNIPVLVPGQRVATLAKENGFNTVISANSATEEAMWHALESYLRQA